MTDNILHRRKTDTPRKPAAGRAGLYPTAAGVWESIDEFGVKAPLASSPVGDQEIHYNIGNGDEYDYPTVNAAPRPTPGAPITFHIWTDVSEYFTIDDYTTQTEYRIVIHNRAQYIIDGVFSGINCSLYITHEGTPPQNASISTTLAFGDNVNIEVQNLRLENISYDIPDVNYGNAANIKPSSRLWIRNVYHAANQTADSVIFDLSSPSLSLVDISYSTLHNVLFNLEDLTSAAIFRMQFSTVGHMAHPTAMDLSAADRVAMNRFISLTNVTVPAGLGNVEG